MTEAVQMLLDGHNPASGAKNLGLSGASFLCRWKEQLLAKSGPAATTLENRVRQLEQELRRVEHKRRYGARRISEELAARQETCSRRRVGRLMDHLGIVAPHG